MQNGNKTAVNNKLLRSSEIVSRVLEKTEQSHYIMYGRDYLLPLALNVVYPRASEKRCFLYKKFCFGSIRGIRSPFTLAILYFISHLFLQN